MRRLIDVYAKATRLSYADLTAMAESYFANNVETFSVIPEKDRHVRWPAAASPIRSSSSRGLLSRMPTPISRTAALCTATVPALSHRRRLSIMACDDTQ